MTYAEYVARCRAHGDEPIGRAMFYGIDPDELRRRDEQLARRSQ
jgi:hypothetical protein